MSNIKKHWDGVPKWAKYTLYAVLGIVGAFLLGLLFGNLIMWLWNWLMPSLFGLRTIGFWEGLGLFLLAKLIFGFGGSSGSGDGEKKHKHDKRQYQHHWEGDKKNWKEWKDWEYYDDWWEEDGKTAFHDYAERMKKEPKEKSAEEKPTEEKSSEEKPE